MGWYVRQLIFNSDRIKRSVVEENSDDVFVDLDSDEYNDLLSVEMKISECIKTGRFTERDQRILSLIASGKSYKSIVDELKMSRRSVEERFLALSNTLSYLLGYHFTDSGYIAFMVKKHNLTEEQAKVLETIVEDTRLVYENY